MAVDIEGWPLSFYCLKSVIVENEPYMVFRTYDQGSVYTAATGDSFPDSDDAQDAWFERAQAFFDTMRIDDAFAEDIKNNATLPHWDAHYYYNDYIISGDADTVDVRYMVSLSRSQVTNNMYNTAGKDSLYVEFEIDEIHRPGQPMTVLDATRTLGRSIVGGNAIEGQTGTGFAYIMPFGDHDLSLPRKMMEDSMPEIIIDDGQP
jgi:hypothetical protein